jgi:Class II flagellar assembly regulator
MKITGTAPLRTTPARRKEQAGRGGTGDFAAELSSASAAGAAAGASPADTVQALLSIQEVPDSTEPGKRAARRGEDLLDQLQDLQQSLLAGALPQGRIVQLAEAVRARRENVADPRLAAILDEIELRCRVELAKLAAAAGA